MQRFLATMNHSFSTFAKFSEKLTGNSSHVVLNERSLIENRMNCVLVLPNLISPTAFYITPFQMWRTVIFEKGPEQLLINKHIKWFLYHYFVFDMLVVCLYINHILRREDIHPKYF